MSFRLVPKSVTSNDLERRNGRLRYFTEFGKPAFQHMTVSACIELAMKSVDLWQNLCASLLYFVVRVRCRR